MKQLKSSSIFALAGTLLLSASAFANTNAALYWNQVAGDMATGAQIDTINNSRTYAILHLAVHDALNMINRRYELYSYPFPAVRDASAEAAVASAARTVLAALIPSQEARINEAYTRALDAVPESQNKKAGILTGRLAAIVTLARRQNDGANLKTRVNEGIQPGEYKPTPPDFIPPFLPHWGRVTPFALRDSAQFRPKPPARLNSDRYTTDYNEVATLGSDTSTVRTEEQSAIAKHWYEDSTEGWNRIARTVAESHDLDLWQSARLFALVNVAMADGFIAGFEAKYDYNFWRPVTAIREGDTDGNSATAGDGNWMPFLVTPPVPDYPSTHSVLGAAAAAVLARFFGTDLVSFDLTSGPPFPNSTRHYWSFSQAAHENAMSRVLAGIHFRSASQAGLEQGEEIGEYIYEKILRPVR